MTASEAIVALAFAVTLVVCLVVIWRWSDKPPEGYRPHGRPMDTSNPPKGGSGVPRTDTPRMVKVHPDLGRGVLWSNPANSHPPCWCGSGVIKMAGSPPVVQALFGLFESLVCNLDGGYLARQVWRHSDPEKRRAFTGEWERLEQQERMQEWFPEEKI